MIVHILICLAIGYCCGCFSTGYVIGRINNIDIRNYGSGNAGTTNALRTLGMKAGLITFLGDALKAMIPILLVRFVLFKNSIDESQLLALYTGLGAVLGHNFPFWLKFRGGKGIAATGGVMLAFDWRFGLTALVLFAICTGITKYVSVGSLAISIIFPIGIVVFYNTDTNFIHMLIISMIFTLLAFIRHRANIKRLFNGTENKIGQKVKIDK